MLFSALLVKRALQATVLTTSIQNTNALAVQPIIYNHILNSNQSIAKTSKYFSTSNDGSKEGESVDVLVCSVLLFVLKKIQYHKYHNYKSQITNGKLQIANCNTSLPIDKLLITKFSITKSKY